MRVTSSMERSTKTIWMSLYPNQQGSVKSHLMETTGLYVLEKKVSQLGDGVFRSMPSG